MGSGGVVCVGVDSASVVVSGGVGSASVVVVCGGVGSDSVAVVGGGFSVGGGVDSVVGAVVVVGATVEGSDGFETSVVGSAGSSVAGGGAGVSVGTADCVDCGVDVSLMLGSDGNPPRSAMRIPPANSPIPASTNPPCNRRCFLID